MFFWTRVHFKGGVKFSKIGADTLEDTMVQTGLVFPGVPLGSALGIAKLKIIYEESLINF